jgi:hypothetical protein
MKKDILNNGIDAVETKQINKSALYFGLLVVVSITAIISLGFNLRNSIINSNLQYQIQQRDSIIYTYKGEIDELTLNNYYLSK